MPHPSSTFVERHRSSSPSHHINGTIISIGGQEWIVGPTDRGFHGTEGGGLNPENYTFDVVKRADGQHVMDEETRVVYIYREGEGIDPQAPYEYNGEFFTLCGINEVAIAPPPVGVEAETEVDPLAPWEIELLNASTNPDEVEERFCDWCEEPLGPITGNLHIQCALQQAAYEQESWDDDEDDY